MGVYRLLSLAQKSLSLWVEQVGWGKYWLPALSKTIVFWGSGTGWVGQVLVTFPAKSHCLWGGRATFSYQKTIVLGGRTGGVG